MKETLFIVIFVFTLLANTGIFYGCYPIPTFITPEIGYYSGDNISFMVYDNTFGKKFIRFSADNYRFDNIRVIGGSFYRKWGDINGTNCPTDAYIIRGRFTSPTTAEGSIRYGYDCSFGKKIKFTAKLSQ
jgi:hypothetical protein